MIEKILSFFAWFFIIKEEVWDEYAKIIGFAVLVVLWAASIVYYYMK